MGSTVFSISYIQTSFAQEQQQEVKSGAEGSETSSSVIEKELEKMKKQQQLDKGEATDPQDQMKTTTKQETANEQTSSMEKIIPEKMSSELDDSTYKFLIITIVAFAAAAGVILTLIAKKKRPI